MLNDDININQGLSETIYNDEPSETETDYKTSTPSDKAVKDAVILTNKNAGQIVLKATSDGKIVQAELNADAENGSEFKVEAKNIKLEGYTTINDGFSVDLEGNMSCSNAKIQGKIESNKGNVGGWIISNRSLNNGTNFIRANGFSNIYTMSDIFVLQAYILNQSWAKQTIDSDQDLFNFYDVNHDGVIDIGDLLRMKKLIMGVET